MTKFRIIGSSESGKQPSFNYGRGLRRWTLAEEICLRERYQEGARFKTIGIMLQRSPESIRLRIRKLKLRGEL